MLNLMSAFPLSPRGESDLPLPAEERADPGDAGPSFDQCLAESCGDAPFSSTGEDPETAAEEPSLPTPANPEEENAWETMSFASIAVEAPPPEDVLAEPNLTDLSLRIGEPEEESGTEWMDLPPIGEAPSAEGEEASPSSPIPSESPVPEVAASADLPSVTIPQPNPLASVPSALQSPMDEGAALPSHVGSAMATPQTAEVPLDTPPSVPVAPESPAEASSTNTAESEPPQIESLPPPSGSTAETTDPASREWTSLAAASAPEQPLPAPGIEPVNVSDGTAEAAGTDPVAVVMAPPPPARSDVPDETAPLPSPPSGSESPETSGVLPPGAEASGEHSGEEESRSFQSGTRRMANLATLAQPISEPALATSAPAPAAPASPAPAAGTLSTFMTPATLLEQLDRVVLQSVRADPRSIRIDLEPASLGHVTLHCRETSAGLAVEITVQNPEVRTLLAAQEQELRLGLESQGLQLGRFSVSCRDGDGRPDADQAGQQRDSGDSGAAPRRSASDAAPVEAPAASRAAGYGIRNRWVA